MKILQVMLFDPNACGPTSVMTPIIKMLKIKKHSVDVLSLYKYSPNREEHANTLGSNYYYTAGEKILSERTVLKYIPDLLTYDIVHIHGIYNLNHIIIAKILKKYNIPYVYSIHGNLMENSLKRSKYKKRIAINLLIKRMLKNASMIHIMAEEEYKDVKKIIGDANYTLISNGVNEITVDRKASNEILTLLFIGRLDVNHKGLDILINALKLKEEKFRKSLKLLLVGPFNSERDKKIINKMIEDSNYLKQIISIEGPKYGDEKSKYYEKADLFIHTSRYEGMPVAVLEAMSAGVPCLVTPQTNMSNIINVSGGGFVVKGLCEEIAQQLDNICKMPKDQLFLKGKNAKEYSISQLNWDKIACQYEQMYKDLINNKMEEKEKFYE